MRVRVRVREVGGDRARDRLAEHLVRVRLRVRVRVRVRVRFRVRVWLWVWVWVWVWVRVRVRVTVVVSASGPRHACTPSMPRDSKSGSELCCSIAHRAPPL